jgi:hypothetical protein
VNLPQVPRLPRRRLAILLGLVSLTLVLAVVAACKQATNRSRDTELEGRQTNQAVLASFLQSANNIEQFQGDEDLRDMINRLNQWMAEQSRVEGWAVDPMAAGVIKPLADFAAESKAINQGLDPARSAIELKGLALQLQAPVQGLASILPRRSIDEVREVQRQFQDLRADIPAAIKRFPNREQHDEVEGTTLNTYIKQIKDAAARTRFQQAVAMVQELDNPARADDPRWLIGFAMRVDGASREWDRQEREQLVAGFVDLVNRQLGGQGDAKIRTKTGVELEFLVKQLNQADLLKDYVQIVAVDHALGEVAERLKVMGLRTGQQDVSDLGPELDAARKAADLEALDAVLKKLVAIAKPTDLGDLKRIGVELSEPAKRLAALGTAMTARAKPMNSDGLQRLAQFVEKIAGQLRGASEAMQTVQAPADPQQIMAALQPPIVRFREVERYVAQLEANLGPFNTSTAMEFTLADRSPLEEMMLLRDLARWARGDEAGDVARAKQLFDWTVRNIHLEPDSPERVMQTPFETLLLGRGTAVERAWVFVLLARQQELSAAVLALRDPDDAAHPQGKPWAVGVLSEANVFLFDPALGLPIPGPDGVKLDEAGQLDIQPATLAQVLADESLLKKLDVPGTSPVQPVTVAQLKNVVALIEASPTYLSERMKVLEAQLAGDDRVILTATPSAQAERFKACKLETQLWMYPYEVQFRRIAQSSDLMAWRAKVIQPFLLASIQEAPAAAKNSSGGSQEEVPLFVEGDVGKMTELTKRKALKETQEATAREHALYTGRCLHLKGKFLGSPGATDRYLASRPTAKRMKELFSALQRPEDRAQVTALYDVAKQDASYWLGLLAFEQGERSPHFLPSAVEWLRDHTLSETPNGPWTPAANYNLARTFELQHEYAQAIRHYRAADVPGYGSRLRSTWLATLTKTNVPEEKPATTPAKPSKNDPTDLPGLPTLPGLSDMPEKPAKPEKIPPEKAKPEKVEKVAKPEKSGKPGK